ncbi:hypothetical protein HGB25_02260 [Candidatus Saccharibacteria bacterium]|nr:hypothetical protein [Candidatus Saccharibacteria bacterium]
MDKLKAYKHAKLYSDGGQILADTAKSIGMNADTVASIEWRKTMYNLALADDISEIDPTYFRPETLVDRLGLDAQNQQLVVSSAILLRANIRSQNADTIKEHFYARADEATQSLNLLRYQAQPNPRDTYAWCQLNHLAISCTYLDSLLDAKQDAESLPQFSVSELCTGALMAFCRTSRLVRHKTWSEVYKASGDVGLNRRIIGKIARSVLLP